LGIHGLTWEIMGVNAELCARNAKAARIGDPTMKDLRKGSVGLSRGSRNG